MRDRWSRPATYGGSIKFDLRTTASDGVHYPVIILVGAGMTLLYPAPPPGTGWTSYDVSLTPPGWKLNDYFFGFGVSQAQMTSVLSNLSALYINGDWLTDPETTGLDNVRMLPP